MSRSSAAIAASIVAGAVLCACSSSGGSSAQSTGPASVSTTPATATASTPAPASTPATEAATSPSSAPTSSAPASAHVGLTGCSLISQAEASAAAGLALPPGKSDSYTLSSLIVAHSGCGFNNGNNGVAYDLNTVSSSVPIEQYESLGWSALLSKGATKITVDGYPGISITIATDQQISFYKGQTGVIVNGVNVKAGAPLVIAKLIAARM